MRSLAFLALLFFAQATHGFAAAPPSADALRLLSILGPENCEESEFGYYCFHTIAPRLTDITFARNFQSSGNCLAHLHGLRFRDEDVDPRETITYFQFERALESPHVGPRVDAEV